MAGLVIWSIGIFLVHVALKSIYRLYFHPLSKFLGPKLAAITSGYEFYFNVFKGGMFIWEMERLHQVYGPIIRINPREIHIKDSKYYDEIYASSARRREKDPIAVAQFGFDGSAFASVSPESHRQRRAPLEKLFSKQAITNIEHIIYSRLEKLCRHLDCAYRSHKVVNLDAGFAGLTSDVIHQYAYGFNSGHLDLEDFNEGVRDGINGLFRLCHLTFFFPILQTIMNSLPLGLLKRMSPDAFALVSQTNGIYQKTADALHGHRSDGGSIMETLADSNMSEHMKTPARLTNEGFALVIAGTETTARSLALGAYTLLSNEVIRNKLQEELRSVMPTLDSRPTWNQLEKYLSGIVSETLRLSTGIASRSPRVAPAEALVYKDYVIPHGTLVSETNYFVLTDPNIFPDPHVFDPERWMRAAAKGERLDRYLVNFSKGSRICLGMNMAYAELFLVLATLVRRYEMELYETTKENLEFKRDFGTPHPDKGGSHIRVMVTGMIQE